jgi:adenine-specific DNA-methyltransferase
MNPDLHMADELKNTGGQPVRRVRRARHRNPRRRRTEIRVKVKGVDVFDPNTGDIRSNDTKGIAAWFIDTDYNEESFFVRHAYFLGANDPYKSLKTALRPRSTRKPGRRSIRDTSRPFRGRRAAASR